MEESQLSKVQQALERYNEAHPQEKYALVKQERIPVKDLYVCVYNESHVGLFQKRDWMVWNWKSFFPSLTLRYDAGDLYVGVDSTYVGIKVTHNETGYMSKNVEIGERRDIGERSYVSNCTIESEMGFDDLRMVMYRVGELSFFEPGLATSEEVLAVLNFAVTYYGLEEEYSRQRKPRNKMGP